MSETPALKKATALNGRIKHTVTAGGIVAGAVLAGTKEKSMTSKCKTCGAPVNLAPDGDPKYDQRELNQALHWALGENERLKRLVNNIRKDLRDIEYARIERDMALRDLEAARNEINARKGDPVTRLHNLCAGLGEVEQDLDVAQQTIAKIRTACMRDPLFRLFSEQGFWHAHHVDVVWRHNGQERRHEADWIKDVWYALRGKT